MQAVKDKKRLGRFALALVLVGVAPIGSVLAFYLAGAEFLSDGAGFVWSVALFWMVPWVAIILAAATKGSWPFRTAVFVGALVAPVGLTVALRPGPVAQTLGFVHHLRRTFSPDDLRECATLIRQRQRAGLLKRSSTFPSQSEEWSKSEGRYVPSFYNDVVDESELPASLRGRFVRVYVGRSTSTGGQQVVFEIGPRTGIICDDRESASDVFPEYLAPGVRSYRDVRE